MSAEVMSTNFVSDVLFPHEVLPHLLLLLPARDLVRAQAVCRAWKAAVPAARKQAFLQRWGFHSATNEPRHASLYELIDQGTIVHKHTIGPYDSLPLLSLRYDAPMPVIKRLNNLVGEALLHHRHALYIPVTDASHMANGVATFEFSSLLCRELVVLTMDPAVAAAAAAARGEVLEEEGAEKEAAPPPPIFNRMLLREFRAAVRVALGPGLPTDMDSARFYLQEAKGNAQHAARMFVEDMSFDGHSRALLMGSSSTAASSNATTARYAGKSSSHHLRSIVPGSTSAQHSMGSTNTTSSHSSSCAAGASNSRNARWADHSTSDCSAAPPPEPFWLARLASALFGCGICRRSDRNRRRTANGSGSRADRVGLEGFDSGGQHGGGAGHGFVGAVVAGRNGSELNLEQTPILSANVCDVHTSAGGGGDQGLSVPGTTALVFHNIH